MFSFRQTLEYLDEFTNYERSGFARMEEAFDLARLRSALAELGDPHLSCATVHVAGTKGKGSVSSFISSILESYGYNVGLYTSPHLESPLERITVNGEHIGEKEFVHVVEHLRSTLPGKCEEEFTFFEMYTLIAMLYFSMRGVNAAVFETGLGGRLDATNVIEPQVCVITPISHDHMEVLGESIEEIAREKCGIIKKGARCVSAAQTAEAQELIRGTCARLSVPLETVGVNTVFHIESYDSAGTRFHVHTPGAVYEDCAVQMLGSHQAANAALAITACENFLGRRRMKPDRVPEAIARVHVPARMELVAGEPLVILDGAQNRDSARMLAVAVKDIFPEKRITLIVGISQHKDISGLMKELEPLAERIILTRSSSPRAMDPNIMRGHVSRSGAEVTSDAAEALGRALAGTDKDGLVLVCGSFYLAADMRRMMSSGTVPARAVGMS